MSQEQKKAIGSLVIKQYVTVTNRQVLNQKLIIKSDQPYY